ncbi:MAG: hypothetical protein ACR2KK_13195 [Acidimicrobiales bacterium]
MSTTVGGTAPGARNFVAGNTQYGLILSSPGVTGNVIQGNNIGLLPTGAAGPNGAGGVILANGANGNQIGGTAVGAGNRISRNNGAGVAVADAATTGNSIRGNAFSSNAGLGIDLWPGGVTPNDAGDGDTGPNRLQNYPVLTSAVNGTSTVVRGSLASAPNTTFRIEFFSSPGADPTLYGEGANYLGATSATTNAAGNTAVFALTAPATVPAGQVVTATATDPAGNTSEFSLRVVVA